MEADDAEDKEPAGEVTVRLSGKVTTDAWADYEGSFAVREENTFLAASPSHYGWCIGVEAVRLAKTLVAGRTCNDAEAMNGLMDYLKHAAEMHEEENEDEDT